MIGEALCTLVTMVAQTPAQPIWILRGDDFGITHASNVGLRKAIEGGLLKSASIIVNGAWIGETVAILKEHPEVEVGVHVALVSDWDRLRWPPVADGVASLVAPDGNLWRSGVTWLSPFARANPSPLFGKLGADPADIEKEIRAQVRRAQELGLRVDYIDCHNSQACIGVALPILRKIADELGVPIPESENQDGRGTPPMMEYLDTEAESLRRRTMNDYTAYRDALLKDIEAMQPGKVYRTVLHPAIDNDEARAIDTRRGAEEAKIRANELRLATDPMIKAAVERKGIRLLGPSAVVRMATSQSK